MMLNVRWKLHHLPAVRGTLLASSSYGMTRILTGQRITSTQPMSSQTANVTERGAVLPTSSYRTLLLLNTSL